jgi:hypothetical protein
MFGGSVPRSSGRPVPSRCHVSLVVGETVKYFTRHSVPGNPSKTRNCKSEHYTSVRNDCTDRRWLYALDANECVFCVCCQICVDVYCIVCIICRHRLYAKRMLTTLACGRDDVHYRRRRQNESSKVIPKKSNWAFRADAPRPKMTHYSR